MHLHRILVIVLLYAVIACTLNTGCSGSSTTSLVDITPFSFESVVANAEIPYGLKDEVLRIVSLHEAGMLAYGLPENSSVDLRRAYAIWTFANTSSENFLMDRFSIITRDAPRGSYDKAVSTVEAYLASTYGARSLSSVYINGHTSYRFVLSREMTPRALAGIASNLIHSYDFILRIEPHIKLYPGSN